MLMSTDSRVIETNVCVCWFLGIDGFDVDV